MKLKPLQHLPESTPPGRTSDKRQESRDFNPVRKSSKLGSKGSFPTPYMTVSVHNTPRAEVEVRAFC